MNLERSFMGRGKRYNGSEHKLNMKKVVAVIIAILVIIMFIIILTKLAQPKQKQQKKTFQWHTILHLATINGE